MNKALKNLVIVLSIIAIFNSMHAVESVKLLNEYGIRADNYARLRSKTEKTLLNVFAIGAAAATTAVLNRYWHVDLLKAAYEGGLPAAGTTFAVSEFIFPFIKPIVRWLHMEHTLFGHHVPLSLSYARSRKKETAATIERSLATNDPIDPVRMYANISFAHNPFIMKLLQKLESKRTQILDPTKSIPDYRDIAGGYEREILEIILYMTAPERAQALGKRMSRGILFYGPSGTGKTLKATQIAAMVQAAMKDVVVGELKDKWQGGSEENIREMFAEARQRIENLEALDPAKKRILARNQQIMAAIATISLRLCDLDEQIAATPEGEARNGLTQARANLQHELDNYDAQMHQDGNHDQAINNLLRLAGFDPAQLPEYHAWGVTFVDEIDGFGSRKGSHNGSDVSNGMITQLLGQMDGADKDKNKNILVIGTTNRIDMLDRAFLRPGRFDKQVYMGIPTTAEQRLAYLNFFGTTDNPPAKGKYRVEQAVRDRFQEIAQATENFSQADFDGLFNKAVDIAMIQNNNNPISWDQMQRALRFMIDKKADDQRATFAQQMVQNIANMHPIIMPQQRLAYLNYFGGNGATPGIYPVNPEAQQHFEEVARSQNTAFFSPVDIKSIFESAAGLAMQNDHEIISWPDMQNALQIVRLRKRMALLHGVPAPQALQQAPAAQPANAPAQPIVNVQQPEVAPAAAQQAQPAAPQDQPAQQPAPQAQPVEPEDPAAGNPPVNNEPAPQPIIENQLQDQPAPLVDEQQQVPAAAEAQPVPPQAQQQEAAAPAEEQAQPAIQQRDQSVAAPQDQQVQQQPRSLTCVVQ